MNLCDWRISGPESRLEHTAVLVSHTSCLQEAGGGYLPALTGQVRKPKCAQSLRASVSSSAKWGDHNNSSVICYWQDETDE